MDVPSVPRPVQATLPLHATPVPQQAVQPVLSTRETPVRQAGQVPPATPVLRLIRVRPAVLATPVTLVPQAAQVSGSRHRAQALESLEDSRWHYVEPLRVGTRKQSLI